jgi:diguanylate cyclase (GGDEF)-like protein
LWLFAGGAALMLAALPSSSPRRWLVTGIGAALALVGLAAGLARLFGASLGVEFPLLSAASTGGTAPERMAPVAAIAFIILGVALATLPFAAAGRRGALALVIGAGICAAVGTTSLAGYLLHVEFLISWPSSTPLPPVTALGITLVGLGVCRTTLRRSSEVRQPGTADEGRSILLTAIWTLSLIAAAAGISTFALAQYEYQDVVHADLMRTLRERRAFLEYAIRQHVEQVGIAARPLAADIVARPRDGDRRALAARLQTAGDALVREGFSGWRFESDASGAVTSGTFIEAPDVALQLIGRYHTELMLKDGYYLRTRVAVRAGDDIIGWLVAEERFPELTRLKLEADSWGETGEMALCAAAGADMTCFPLRSNPRVDSYSRSVNAQPLPMSLALDHESGIAETLDYRQHRVLAAYGPVGFTGLGMVIKIDAAELNRPLGRRFGSAVLLLLALVAAGVFLLRRRLQPLTRELIEAREEARRVAAQFKAAAESSLDAYFILDAVRDARHLIADFRIRYLNASGEVLMRRPSEDVLGKTLHEFLSAAQAEYFVKRYRRIVSTGESLSEEFRTQDADTGASWVAHQAVKLGDGVSVTARDITKIKSVERQLRDRAENDVLTGLPNRTLFFERLGRALVDAREGQTGVAVLFLDLDRFKKVNDTYGHAAGDAVLREFAVRLRALVRGTDTVARLGGDEFAVILPGLPTIERAERVAADIVTAIRVPFDVEAVRLNVGTSIGVAFSNGINETPESLVGRADRKLYQAKSGGRGRFSSAAGKRAA